MARLNKKHFEVFKKEIRKWVNIFGLKCWELRIEFEKLDDARAQCSTDVNNKIAVITLSSDWADDTYLIGNYYVKQSAFHEVMELFLADYHASACWRSASSEDLEEKRHSIIRTLENVLWDK